MIFGTAYFRCCLLLAVAGRLARAELGVLSAELEVETRLTLVCTRVIIILFVFFFSPQLPVSSPQ
ncbi:MAG: hypothetical protein RMY64_27365 [Nostoc sp. DedQUE08]|uniref:hypothetical protein n=1 Tax=unclassified Nostoc TaxID=2593658 RepID=UPI002AD510E5|nr:MULTISPECIES: hypothetical protein [unclassified Nostoc]MDZ8034309.1 hypothetical protein [Nostoc sp. DedSLP04]MDZ8069290.1 hypothetical protein [Nostoc sp. DedQUE08]MDZ8092560.1 hypothetical protein [Nostoc sp. DedQUE05]